MKCAARAARQKLGEKKKKRRKVDGRREKLARDGERHTDEKDVSKWFYQVGCSGNPMWKGRYEACEIDRDRRQEEETRAS